MVHQRYANCCDHSAFMMVSTMSITVLGNTLDCDHQPGKGDVVCKRQVREPRPSGIKQSYLIVRTNDE